MKRFMVEGDEVAIPNWVDDLESFRRWSDDDEYPETGRIAFLRGEVWVDMSKEQLFTHNLVKTELTSVLCHLVNASEIGLYFGDGAFVSNEEADISNQPDGVFVSFESVEQGRVRVVEGKQEGFVELEGTPDMVLEVVSRSSVRKDTKILRDAYAVAGIREYWLVDARKGPLHFDLLRLSRGQYVATRKRDGWVRSDVFDHWFRLRQEERPQGFPRYLLDASAERPT